MATIDVRHDGLGRFERVFAPTQALAEQRADAVRRGWDEEAKRRASHPAAAALTKIEAEETSLAAERALHGLTAILIGAVRAAPLTDWSALTDNTPFAEAAPLPPAPPLEEPEPQQSEFPRAPLTLLTLVNPRALRRRREAAETKYETAHSGWRYLKRWRESEYEKALKVHRDALAGWRERETAFLERQARANARLDALADGYGRADPDAVTGLCDLNLLSLERPAGFPQFWTMRFADGALQIDYDLPSLDAVPVVKTVKPARGALEVAVLPERERERLYGEAVFQTALAVVHTLFAGDAAGVVRAVSLNGWVNYIDGTAMRPGRACILSLAVDRSLFTTLDLAGIDPEACFRALNGTMSPKLAALVAR